MSNTTAFVRDHFDSISEGCFLVMPSKKRKLNEDKLTKKKSKIKGFFFFEGHFVMKKKTN
ncbi:hypothetical protein BCV72DRAFT_196975 [Rhizopus microsporus var. microsporus]|uniref:Uncharacterized protein n=1 Tax=Rhizopus microsporus var. microsporus TaxID=86635 RepID=A0A1X0RIV4_RHIZD|nr:hypothetical protein BCV72DRAFT_196975 [Rhizopus microsporus var. microsporus]